MLRPYLPSFTDLILQPLVESSAGSHSPGALFCWKALTSWVLPARFNPSTSTRLVIPPCNSKVYVEMLPPPSTEDGRVARSKLTVLYPRETLYPLLGTGSTQEDRKSTRHDWKIVDWDAPTQNTTTQSK